MSISSTILPTYGKGAWTPTWVDGSGTFARCGKMTHVFGVPICVTPEAWSNGQEKVNHVAHVLAQLLDNDADGVANDQDVVKYMAAYQKYLWVPDTEDDSENGPQPAFQGQMTGLWEAHPNCCDTPSNRGASDTDRSTWPGAVDNTPGTTGCNTNRDATIEEVHHLIGEAAAQVFPDIWATTSSSQAGRAILPLNGDCGWGHSSDWTNPSGSGSSCTGTYAYNDPTCDEACIVMEGIYWSSITWMGGLYTTDRANSVGSEWLMTVPDAGMNALPSGWKNPATLEEGAPALYNLISNTTRPGHLWLPSIMPNGAYNVTNESAVASSGTYPMSDSPSPSPSPSAGSSSACQLGPAALVALLSYFF